MEKHSFIFHLSFFTLLVLSIPGFGRVICDTACHTPEDEFRNYAVVSPVGRSMVTHIEQAPRLTTLDNKTIAVVGVSFMAHITHPEIKRIIEENYQNVTVLLTDVTGSSVGAAKTNYHFAKEKISNYILAHQ